MLFILLVLVAFGVGIAITVAYVVVEVRWHGGFLFSAGLVALPFGLLGLATVGSLAVIRRIRGPKT